MSDVAGTLNRTCPCVTTDRDRLRAVVEAADDAERCWEDLAELRPHLFASSALFLDPSEVERIRAVVRAVEEVVALPAWQARAVAGLPDTAGRDAGPRGVFFGYDFHLGGSGPQLIEINTNAGGALVNLALARAQQACCAAMDLAVQGVVPLADLEDQLVAMFRAEHALAGGGELRSIAIVDEDPASQFMYPEFRMFRQLLERRGLAAVIASPAELEAREDGLYAGELRIDLVYDRLTDFYLQAPGNAAIRAAWERGQLTLTPHPRAHALYAHKRNLMALSDPATLALLGVSAEATATLLAGVPRTLEVTPEGADALWADRKSWFFKPGDGFGSRAAYRGDKLTKGKWAEIVASGGYVAQKLVPPSERLVQVDGAPQSLKVDVRAYVYDGQVQLFAARLYQGQTTNLRTPGGGFAAVLVPVTAA